MHLLFAVPFNLTLLVSIVLSNKATATIDFGTLSLGISSDTEEAFMEVPIVENLGNSLIVVNLSSNNFLSVLQQHPPHISDLELLTQADKQLFLLTLRNQNFQYHTLLLRIIRLLYDFNETAQANVHFGCYSAA